MNVDDILLLAKQGFNAQQIGAMLQAQTVQPQPPQTVAQPQPQPQQQPLIQQMPQPQPIPQPQPVVQPVLDPIMAQLEKLTGAIQANNLLNTNMPQQQQTADDILATIINPEPIK